MLYLYLPAALAVFLSFSSLAANQAPEEIIVSGYRPVALGESDTSLSLLNEQTIRRASLSHAEELIQLVPNLTFSGEGSRARYFQLRGIGEREQYEGSPNPSVGLVLDDIDLSGIGGVASTFDITQVDVLRGPQSARYGSSALAGLIYMQSGIPEQGFAALAELTAGTEATSAAGVMFNGGLSDAVIARVSVYQYRDDGFRSNAWLGRDDTNSRDELTARMKLAWQISDRWDAVFAGLYADFNNGYDAFALDNSAVTFSDEPGTDSQRTRAGSVRLTGHVNNAMDLVAISNFATSDIDFSYDGDWVNEAFWLPIVSDYRYSNPRKRDSLGQELRLVSRPDGRILGGSTDWVAGLHWNRLSESNRIESSGEYVDLDVGCDPGICITDRRIDSEFEADTWALFLSTESRLTDRLQLSLGLRIEHRKADYDDVWLDNGVFVDGQPVSSSNAFAPDDTMVGGHISLAYDFRPDWRGYARIARGFKAGGFNPSLAALGALPDAATIGPVDFRPEYLWNYELGLRGSWLDDSVRMELSAFFMDRRRAQLSQSAQIDPFDPNTFVFVTANGAAETFGAEAALHWQLNQHWALHASMGLLESEITEWPVRPLVEGRRLAHAPRYDAGIGLGWTGSAGWFARIDLNAVGDYYFDISHDNKADAYQVVNLRLGREWENWELSFWGRNILDENYATRGFFFGNEPPDFAPRLYTRFGAPRQLGITLSYRY